MNNNLNLIEIESTADVVNAHEMVILIPMQAPKDLKWQEDSDEHLLRLSTIPIDVGPLAPDQI